MTCGVSKPTPPTLSPRRGLVAVGRCVAGAARAPAPARGGCASGCASTVALQIVPDTVAQRKSQTQRERANSAPDPSRFRSRRRRRAAGAEGAGKVVY